MQGRNRSAGIWVILVLLVLLGALVQVAFLYCFNTDEPASEPVAGEETEAAIEVASPKKSSSWRLFGGGEKKSKPSARPAEVDVLDLLRRADTAVKGGYAATAIQYYTAASEAGNADADFRLGMLHASAGRLVEAEACWKLAVERGSPDAAAKLKELALADAAEKAKRDAAAIAERDARAAQQKLRAQEEVRKRNREEFIRQKQAMPGGVPEIFATQYIIPFVWRQEKEFFERLGFNKLELVHVQAVENPDGSDAFTCVFVPVGGDDKFVRLVSRSVADILGAEATADVWPAPLEAGPEITAKLNRLQTGVGAPAVAAWDPLVTEADAERLTTLREVLWKKTVVKPEPVAAPTDQGWKFEVTATRKLANGQWELADVTARLNDWRTPPLYSERQLLARQAAQQDLDEERIKDAVRNCLKLQQEYAVEVEKCRAAYSQWIDAAVAVASLNKQRKASSHNRGGGWSGSGNDAVSQIGRLLQEKGTAQQNLDAATREYESYDKMPFSDARSEALKRKTQAQKDVESADARAQRAMDNLYRNEAYAKAQYQTSQAAIKQSVANMLRALELESAPPVQN